MKVIYSLLIGFLLCFEGISLESAEVSVSDIFIKRHSGKAYDSSKTVSNEKFKALMEATRWTPSSHNDQPWYFIVCDREQTPEAYHKVMQSLKGSQQNWVRNAPLLLVVVSRPLQTYNNKPNEWAEYDTGAAALSFALQAADLDLMAHQIGGFNKEMIAKEFQIPDNYKPLTIMVIGYEEESPELPPAPRERRPARETFFFGEWGNPYENFFSQSTK